jgi:Flp pilus assembly protein TadG
MKIPFFAKSLRSTASLGRRLRRCEAGQSLLELALATPVLLTMLLGAIELGRMFYLAIEVRNAARAGVAFGAQTVTYSADSAGITQAAQNDAADISGLSVTPSTYCVCSNNPGTQVACSPNPCTGTGVRQILFVKVNTSAQFQTLTHFPGLPSPYTLTGQAIMRVPQ